LADLVAPEPSATLSISSTVTLSVRSLPVEGITHEWTVGTNRIVDQTSASLTLSTSQLPWPSQNVGVTVRYNSSFLRSASPTEFYTWTVNNNGATSSGTPHWWLSYHGLGVSDGIDEIDHDGDGQNTRQEYIADTIPSDINSVLRTESIKGGNDSLVVQWPTSPNRRYTLLWSDNLASWNPVPNYEDLAGTGRTVKYPDSVGLIKRRFYKVRVRIP
jgi:hypothetical protein